MGFLLLLLMWLTILTPLQKVCMRVYALLVQYMLVNCADRVYRQKTHKYTWLKLNRSSVIFKHTRFREKSFE